jgi:hypothetical protein
MTWRSLVAGVDETGSRRIVGNLLSPLVRYSHNSLRER